MLENWHSFGVPLTSVTDEEMRISCRCVSIRYTSLDVAVEVVRVTLEQIPAPLDLPPLVKVPALRLNLTYRWLCNGNPENYHFHPIICAGGHSVSLSESAAEAEAVTDDLFWAFRSYGLALTLSAHLLPESELPDISGKSASPVNQRIRV